MECNLTFEVFRFLKIDKTNEYIEAMDLVTTVYDLWTINEHLIYFIILFVCLVIYLFIHLFNIL